MTDTPSVCLPWECATALCGGANSLEQWCGSHRLILCLCRWMCCELSFVPWAHLSASAFVLITCWLLQGDSRAAAQGFSSQSGGHSFWAISVPKA